MSACRYLLVESSVACPSHRAIVAVSTGVGARSSRIAAVWRSTCGVMFLPASDGHRPRAVVVCLTTSRQIALRVRCPPFRLGNSGPAGSPPSSRTQTRRTCLASRLSGVHLSFLPLPSHLTQPAPRLRSWQRRLASSDALSPVCTANSSSAWSRRRSAAKGPGDQQRVDLWLSEVADQRRVESLLGDREHASDLL